MKRFPGECKDCVFYDTHEYVVPATAGEAGFCLAKPPVSNGSTNVSAWPIVRPHFGCGEFEQAPASVLAPVKKSSGLL